jgi:protein-S-isoprenylcysteine O-methyltransferase Ste14
VALAVVGMPAVGLIVQRYNAPVLEARSNWRHKDTARFDKIFLAIYGPLISIQPALAGLDAGRYHWTSLPFGFVYVGSILFAGALALITWVMVVNPFAEKTVRIQTDRGQTVVTSGPYRYVRHPMYVGLILLFVSTALVWGSVWALRLDAVMAVVLIWRTAREDRTLRQELLGYEQYASVTRYRLLPGLW